MQRKCRYNRDAPQQRTRHHQRSRNAELYTWHRRTTPRKTSRFSRGWSRSASGPACTSAASASAGLHHLVWEILDNAIDEAMNGYASNIRVTLHEDGSSITIEDDGRGIPVDKHPTTKKSALEVIFTVLHAGGKFEHGSYKTAGGLHGVGASVVNALSKELVATVKRDGAQWEMRFKQGKPVGPLKKLGAARGTGTTVYFHPDAAIFPKIEFDRGDHPRAARGRQLPAQGAEGRLRRRDARRQDRSSSTPKGIVDYLKKIVAERGAKPVHDAPFTLTKDDGLRLDLVLQWTEATDEHIRSYVNGIPTGSGGTHENGLRAGHRQGGAQLHRHAQPVAERRDAHRRGHPRRADRRAQRLHRGAAVPGTDQGSPEQPGAASPRSTAWCGPALEHWLNHNISVAEAIVARIILAARAREASRAAQAEVSRKSATSTRLNLPGKLSDCTNSEQRGQRALHRRRRFGRRLGEAGARSRAPGDPAAARQGAEHRERVAGEGAREQGAVGSGHRDRLRPRQELRARQAALRQDHHPRRRRFRRQPHRDAAADVHLPPPAAADARTARSSSRSRRSTASTSARRRSGRSTMRRRTRS